MKRSLMVLMTSFLSLCIAHPAISATIFSESTDVGDQIGTAQAIGNFSSGDILAGDLTDATSNADLFHINLIAGTAFSATVSDRFLDSQLFLFDATGKGLTGNDNSSNTLLNASFTFTPSVTGTYYLAISGTNFDPKDSSGNFIFNDVTTGNFSITSAASLASWAKRDSFDFDPAFGDYEITLSLAAVSAVPEPSILPGLLALAGGLGLAIFRRKQIA